MHAQHPRIAARWDKETDFSKLPESARKEAIRRKAKKKK
jgi:hypothetical protein